MVSLFSRWVAGVPVVHITLCPYWIPVLPKKDWNDIERLGRIERATHRVAPTVL